MSYLQQSLSELQYMLGEYLKDKSKKLFKQSAEEKNFSEEEQDLIREAVILLKRMDDAHLIYRYTQKLRELNAVTKEQGAFVFAHFGEESDGVAGAPAITHIDILDIDEFLSFFKKVRIIGDELLRSEIQMWYYHSLFNGSATECNKNNYEYRIFEELCMEGPYISNAVEYAINLLEICDLRNAACLGFRIDELEGTDDSLIYAEFREYFDVFEFFMKQNDFPGAAGIAARNICKRYMRILTNNINPEAIM